MHQCPCCGDACQCYDGERYETADGGRMPVAECTHCDPDIATGDDDEDRGFGFDDFWDSCDDDEPPDHIRRNGGW